MSLAQENSEEISLDISLTASSRLLLSVPVTAGINSVVEDGESSSFERPKTDPVESRCTPLQSCPCDCKRGAGREVCFDVCIGTHFDNAYLCLFCLEAGHVVQRAVSDQTVAGVERRDLVG